MKTLSFALSLAFCSVISLFAFGQNNSDTQLLNGPLIEMEENQSLKSMLGFSKGRMIVLMKGAKKSPYAFHKYDENLIKSGEAVVPSSIHGVKATYTYAKMLGENVFVLLRTFEKNEFKVFSLKLDCDAMKLGSPQLVTSFQVKSKGEYSDMSWRWRSVNNEVNFIVNYPSNVKKEGLKKVMYRFDENLKPVSEPLTIAIPTYDKDDKSMDYCITDNGELLLVLRTVHKGKEKQESDFDYFLNRVDLQGNVVVNKIKAEGRTLNNVKIASLRDGRVAIYGWNRTNGFLKHKVFFTIHQSQTMDQLYGGFTTIPTSFLIEHADPYNKNKMTKWMEKEKTFIRGYIFAVDLIEKNNGDFFLTSTWYRKKTTDDNIGTAQGTFASSNAASKPNQYTYSQNKVTYYYEYSAYVFGFNANAELQWKKNIAKNQVGVGDWSPANGFLSVMDADNNLNILFNDNVLNDTISEGESAEFLNSNYSNQTFEQQSFVRAYNKGDRTKVQRVLRNVSVLGDGAVLRKEHLSVEQLSAKEYSDPVLEKQPNQDGDRQEAYFRIYPAYHLELDGYVYLYQASYLSYHSSNSKTKVKYIARFVKTKL